MEKQRFVETGKNSFYGDHVYGQIVPSDHFLRKLRELIDGEHFTRKLIRLYKGEGLVGRPPFDPALELKMRAGGLNTHAWSRTRKARKSNKLNTSLAIKPMSR